ncbi:LAMI_0E11870g1_1 [Lachancea mirantina]|uniref:LAMI_0E11870g1_1 n=1 Tax=Lachancea mirantina TaxID=1230905 RepID=A0A1G4JPQ5_9SACH|nr:LAMI_0E11870g1_1 [Lachancea mirantina]
MSLTTFEQAKDVLSFCVKNKIYFSSFNCEVKPSSAGGIGVFAKSDIDANTVLLRVPKSAVFSASNSSIANLLVDEEIDGVLALTLAFLYEREVFGPKSNWYSYLQTIQLNWDQESLYLPPSFWPSNRKRLMEQTALGTLFHGLDNEGEILSAFSTAVEVSRKWHAEARLSPPSILQNDTSANSLRFVATVFTISSRAFEVDAFHETALVPVADLFNHHALHPDVRFESTYEVCTYCGEFGVCGHAEFDEEEANDAEIFHEGGIAQSRNLQWVAAPEFVKELEKEAAKQLKSSIKELIAKQISKTKPGSVSLSDLDPQECVDVVLMRGVEKHHEIFNSYGDLPNPLLLARYGFCVRDNPNDLVHLAPELKKLCFLKKLDLKPCFLWWIQDGFLLFQEASGEVSEADGGRSSFTESIESDSDAENEIETNSDQLSDEWQQELCLNSSADPSAALKAFLNLLGMKSAQRAKFFEDVERNSISAVNKWLISKPLGTQARKLLNVVVKKKRNSYNSLLRSLHGNSKILVLSELHIIEKLLTNDGK